MKDDVENQAVENNELIILNGAMKQRIARFTDGGELHTTPIGGLSLIRRDAPSEPLSNVYVPSICMVFQGCKRVTLGDDTFVYNAERYLITSVNLPTVVQILDVSPQKPYLGLKLLLDMREISEMMLDSSLPAPGETSPRRGMATGKVTLPLLNAFLRLVDLLDVPEDIPILAPTIKREITYRLLVGDQGTRLRQIATAGSQSQQIATAVNWLNNNYAEPLKINDLARLAGMSTSTFHHHFRLMTALSPLQYQKHLRLQEARRLMLMERADAASASYQVGYESASQFSREYSRLFGAPPLRDITKLKQIATGEYAVSATIAKARKSGTPSPMY